MGQDARRSSQVWMQCLWKTWRQGRLASGLHSVSSSYSSLQIGHCWSLGWSPACDRMSEGRSEQGQAARQVHESARGRHVPPLCPCQMHGMLAVQRLGPQAMAARLVALRITRGACQQLVTLEGPKMSQSNRCVYS